MVASWVEESFRATDAAHWYRDVELKSQPSGQVMLEAKPDGGLTVRLHGEQQDQPGGRDLVHRGECCRQGHESGARHTGRSLDPLAPGGYAA